MRLRLSLLLSVALRALGAQGTVVGTLHDSLHLAEGRRPIANAMVTLVELDRAARTDANGRFTFDRVPAGRHTLRFWSPALDVVGLSALTTAIEVADGALATAELATPSRATFAQLVCGAPLDPDDGILLGSVIDAVSGVPVANAVVRARWQETLIGRRNLTSRTRVEERRTDAGGDFAICGVPASDSFDVQAVLGARRTSAIIHALDEPLGRLDLRLTPDAGRRAPWSGVVLDTAGRRVADALIGVEEDSARISQRTDSAGRFSLGVPLGTHLLVARRLGFTPHRRVDRVGATGITRDTVYLRPLPPLLTEVRVFANGPARTLDELAYRERQRRGRGTFIDDGVLQRITTRSVSVISSFIPRADFTSYGSDGGVVFRRGDGTRCRPLFVLDGIRVAPFSVQEEETWYRRAKRIEAYVDTDAPPEYSDFAGCGSLIIWTR